MKNATYYWKLKVMTPVHIGCGEDYEPTGFAVDEKEQTLIAFDPASFLASLEREDLEQYTAICRKGNLESLLEIYRFIHRHRERANGRKITVSDEFIEHHSQTLRLSGQKIGKELNQFQIARTAFNAVDGTPYIPGSALKGSLRTAVLNLRNGKKSQPKYRGRTAGNDMEKELCGGTFATDPFRLVKVGDFHPIGKVRQRIVYAVNRKKKPSEKEARGPYQILEIIEPGTEFIGSITIQEPELNSGIRSPIDLSEIEKALGFYNREQEKETLTLKTIGASSIKPDTSGQGSFLIRLGRHSGAECVTVEGHRDIKIMLGPKENRFLQSATTVWLAAASSKPSSNVALRPFGWAHLSLLSQREAENVRREKEKAENERKQELLSRLHFYRETIAHLRKEREAEELRQRKREEIKKREAEEIKKYPWRRLQPVLEQISDWGSLKTHVLEHKDFLEHQAEKELAEAVAAAAERIGQAIGKKWTGERDQAMTKWLDTSSTCWNPLAPTESGADNPLLAAISGYKSPGDYDRSLVIEELDIDCCRALQPLFRQWNWDKKKKAKPSNHALWKALQDRLRLLRES